MGGDVYQWLEYIKNLVTWIVAIGAGVGTICAFVVRPLKKQAQHEEEQSRKIDMLFDEIKELRKEVENNHAEFCWDRLETLHTKYCDELRWCPVSEKRRIIKWYHEYKAKGLNHLADTYVDDIAKLPEAPQ